MRHTFATQWASSTQNLLALRDQLGHKDLKQTQHYAKFTQSMVKDGYRDFENALENEAKKAVELG